jgi:predicted enzyme related to lactoylglutathione lyase
MAEVTSYAPGTPSWVDLQTSDPEGARAFYGELFGWELEVGGPETGNYALARLRGHNVAGLGGEPAPQGMPTAWTTYFATDDVDGTVKRITDAGGQVMIEPMDVMDQGRMAIASDPTGAVFGLWQAGKMPGASLVNEPGTLSWNELATRDLDGARRFYAAVFGHGWDDVDTGEGGPPYATFSVQGRSVGGGMQMDDSWPAQVPAHWRPYFTVDDTDAAVAAVGRLGGSVQMPPTDSPYGRMAAVSDPQGGNFSVIQSPPESAQ